MRNVRCMNDIMEVEHGFELMQRSFAPPLDTEAEKGLRVVSAALDELFVGLSEESIAWFNTWLFQLRNKTYVTCLSEHDPTEKEYGRLSMWRSYTANQVGVGLVINPLPLYSLSNTFGAFSSPVYYFGDNELRDLFIEISENIKTNKDFLQQQGRDEAKGYFCMLLRAIAMCSKHPRNESGLASTGFRIIGRRRTFSASSSKQSRPRPRRPSRPLTGEHAAMVRFWERSRRTRRRTLRSSRLRNCGIASNTSAGRKPPRG